MRIAQGSSSLLAIASLTFLTVASAQAQDPVQATSNLLSEVTSPVNDWVQAPAHKGFCLDDTPGTLMNWSYGNATGGPDLSEPLVTDRPDFTEASSTVGNGVAQIEFGYTFTENRDNGDTERSHSIGEPLLRAGILANWLELRVALFPVETETTTGGASTDTGGTEDMYLGFKIGLTPQEGILPEMALIPQMTVPTGSNAFTNDEVLAGLNWIYGWSLTDDIGIAGSTQFNRSIDDTGEGYIEFAQSATCAVSLTDTVGAYAEWYALFPSGADTAQVERTVNGGLTYLFNNDVQWAVRAG
nr:transporter [Planctomycetota bacterium]